MRCVSNSGKPICRDTMRCVSEPICQYRMDKICKIYRIQFDQLNCDYFHTSLNIKNNNILITKFNKYEIHYCSHICILTTNQ